MRRYRSHKLVEAQDLKDKKVLLNQNVDGSISVFIGTTNERETIPANRVNAFTLPEIEDGYLVKYEDGFISWSPRKPFEEGYDAIPPDAT
jgi:hypothetical protein